MINLQEQVRKHSVAKNCSDFSLFEKIVLVISKILQILGLQPRISKVFLTEGQNNFGNKIPILCSRALLCSLHSYIHTDTFQGKFFLSYETQALL